MNPRLMFIDLIVAVAAPLIVLAFLLSVSRAMWRPIRRVDAEADAAWLTQAQDVSPAGIELIGRYLRRVRLHRFNGAVIGSSLALLRGLGHDRRVSIGIGPGSPLVDLLLGGMAGLLAGSVLAETWRLRPRGTVRHAELASREPEAGARSLRGAVALLTVTTVAFGAASRQPRPVVLAVAALALLATHLVVLRAIAERGRPALSADLRQADDAIRRFASRRLSIETLATAVLLAGWQLASVHPHLPDTPQAALLWGASLATMTLLHRSRPWPRRRRVQAPSPIPA